MAKVYHRLLPHPTITVTQLSPRRQFALLADSTSSFVNLPHKEVYVYHANKEELNQQLESLFSMPDYDDQELLDVMSFVTSTGLE